MPTPILATKLYIPPSHPHLVNRDRLDKRLHAGLHGKLTLVSAPAGFGKTTLVSAWVQTLARPVAWLALDADDHDPNRFLSYLVAALQRVASTVGQGILRLLQSPQPPATDLLLTTLINELSTAQSQTILVLDDYHLVDSPAIDQALSFLLDHQLPQLHLVITTREDPNLPLARLRARGQLTEIRAADLRFSAAEAATFFAQMVGFPLDAAVVAALEERTEGWIAGLQLAAFSLQGQQPTDKGSIAAFVTSFTGNHRYVMDYLVEEVLQQQPVETQQFLLHTAILERLCGPLCDALLPHAGNAGTATLHRLEDANMFLVPLDNERQWYRYHHLFAELLRQRLTQQSTEVEIATLHSRAAHWYEAAGMDLDAFRHAVAANDIEHAMHLVAGNGMPLHYRGALQPVGQWLRTLSPSVLDVHPALWVVYGSVLTMSGQPTAAVEEVLCAAEAALVGQPANLSQAQSDDLQGQIASLRAMLGIPANDADTIRSQSQRALEFLAPENLPIRTSATWTLGFAYQLKGERAAARQVYQDAIAISERSGNQMVTIAAATCLGQVLESDLQLEQAAASFRQVLEVAGDPPWPAACEAYFGLARIHYQWNQLVQAQELGERGLQMAHQLPNVDTPATCMAFLAKVRLAHGDLEGAEQYLQDAERFVHARAIAHRIPEVAALRVQILLRQGAVAAASQVAEQQTVPVSQARVALAQAKADTALAILKPLYAEMVAKAWRDEQLQLLILQSLAFQQHGDHESAMQALTSAMTLAEPAGFLRIFLDEGVAMHQLLQTAAVHEINPIYCKRLLAEFAKNDSTMPAETISPRPAVTQPAPAPSTAEVLIEPLSDREVEVLHLIAQGLSNREIGERLFIALDTVKGHNRKLFGKLQVQRRTEAVARARDLGLI